MRHFSKILPLFDRFLASKGLFLEITVAGGAALQLLGVVTRATKDCDVVDPDLSEDILSASREFAARNDLPADWLNNGPASLLTELPSDWKERRNEVYSGAALHVFSLGRIDLLRSKLYAYLDRGIDLDDVYALKPSTAEIESLLPWLEERDGNPGWPDYARRSMAEIIRAIKDAK